MLVSYTYGWLSIYPPTVRLSVCLSVHLLVLSCFTADCLSPFRPPAVRLPTDCPSPFRPSTVRQSTDCLSPFHPPTTCLSVHPSVYSLSFFSQRPLTVRRCFDRQLPVYLPDRPSVCLPSTYPLLFLRQLSVIVSTASCPSVHRLSVAISTVDCLSIRRLSVIVSTPAACRSADCPSVCLSICIPALVFPSTVCHRFDHQLPFCLSLSSCFFLNVH